jgi:integrase
VDARSAAGVDRCCLITSRIGLNSCQPPMLRPEDLSNDRNITTTKPFSAWKPNFDRKQDSFGHVVLPLSEEREGRRVYRKQRIGTVLEFPRRRDAEKAVLHLRSNINSENRCPETVSELIAHYKKHELTEESGKRSSTREVYRGFLDLHVESKWGNVKLHELKAVVVEQWLRSLSFAPATKSKIRNIMSALFAHGKRYGIVGLNPIQGVRCSAKRLKEPDVLTPEEFGRLLPKLPQRERVMVLLAGTTGLRRSELIALTWQDVNFDTLEISINKSCVRAQIGVTKTAASAKPVPLSPQVASALREWSKVTPYKRPGDFLFPSLRANGKIPVWPDMILQKVIRPAAKEAGITGKVIGWHTFRHSLGTNLRFLGVDVKVAQELLRHANARITLDLYTQAVSSQKREASAKVVEMLLPLGVRQNLQHPSASSVLEKVAV